MRRLTIAAAGLVLLAAVAAAAPAQRAPAVQMGTTVRPDTVTVGDPFLLVIRVRAPLGTRVAFPAPPDTSGVVEGVDPVAERAGPDSAAVDRTAMYRLVAWDTGRVAIALDDVELDGAVTRALPIGAPTVYVRSVLPVDTAKQVPKPARDIFAAPAVWWWKILLALLVLGLIGLLLWWWWRRRRRRPGELPVEPFVHAEAEFERLEALGLPDAGESGRHVALAADILREYLALRLAEARPSLTSGELLRVLHRRLELPLDPLRTLLAEADMVKFARRAVRPERARAFSREARAIVAETERVEVARAEAAAPVPDAPPRAA